MTDATEIDCRALEGQLPLYVGGDLDVLEAERLGRHLADCPACAAALTRAAAARAVLRAELAEVAGSAEIAGQARDEAHDVARTSLWPGIQSALRAEGLLASRPAHPAAERRATVWLQRAALAAAAGLALWTVPRLFSERGAAGLQPDPSAPALSDLAATGLAGASTPATAGPAQPILAAPAAGLRRLAFDEPTLAELAGPRLLYARPPSAGEQPGSTPAAQFASHLLR